MAKAAKTPKEIDFSLPKYGPRTRSVNAADFPELLRRLTSAVGNVPGAEGGGWYGRRSSQSTAQASGNSVSFYIDRYDRQDHGGGPNGNDWMDEGQINDQYERAQKEYGQRIEAVRRVLVEEGFSDQNVSFEIGEKGHVSIEIALLQVVPSETLIMRGRIADGKATSAELSRMAQSDDPALLSRVASDEKTTTKTLLFLAGKKIKRVERALAQNPKTPKALLLELFESGLSDSKSSSRTSDSHYDDVELLCALLSNPNSPKSLVKKIRAVKSYSPGLLRVAMLANPAFSDEEKQELLSGDLGEILRSMGKSRQLTPAAINLALDSLERYLASANGGPNATDLFYYNLAEIAKHYAADEKIMRRILKIFPNQNQRQRQRLLLEAIAGNSSTSPELLAEVTEEAVSMSRNRPELSLLTTLVKNP